MATYKSAPTFTLDKEYFEDARAITLDLIMKGRFNLMSNGRVLVWIEEELKKFKKGEKKKDLNNTESTENNGK